MSDAFMLPTLPQMPASGSTGTDTRGPAALKANPSGDLSDSSKSFSATLNRISERRYSAKPTTTPAEKTGVTSRSRNTDSSSQQLSETTNRAHDHIEEVPAFQSKESAPLSDPPPDSTSEANLLVLTDLIGDLYSQERQVVSEQLGIGPFEQMQFNISPEAINRAFFDQLTFNAVPQKAGEGMNDNAARLFEFWQGVFPSASTTPDGTLKRQSESSGTKGNKILSPLLQMMGINSASWRINPNAGSPHGLIMAAGHRGAHLNGSLLDRLLTLLPPVDAGTSENSQIGVTGHKGAESNGSLFDRLLMLLSPEQAETLKNSQIGVTGHKDAEPNGSLLDRLLTLLSPEQAETSKNSQIGVTGHKGAESNGSLFDRLLTLLPAEQAETSKNSKIGFAGYKDSISIWATGDLNSETLLDAQNRQISDNSKLQNIQAVLKAAEQQPANPNLANEGITVKTSEEIFGIKSAFQKSEILPVYELGNKFSQSDGESKDSNFLFSQDQMPQHLIRLEYASPSSKASQRSLMSQNLNQIVKKALLTFHNGQNEVQLHLKPDYLGHIRMQIVSEGQQVAIKIVAEFPFVKDMLENNLQQLKASLQSQGLDVDELEVSVAHDSHAERDVHQNAETAKLQAVKTSTDSNDESDEASDQTQSPGSGPMVETVIDYFA